MEENGTSRDLILVACADPRCAYRHTLPVASMWRRTKCPSCGAEGAAIPTAVRQQLGGRTLSSRRYHPPSGLSLLLEDLRSAYNVGSIFRSADAFGVDHISLCGVTATPSHGSVAKTALGADQAVPWEYFPTALEAVDNARLQGVTVCALESTEKAINLAEMTLEGAALLVVGNEVAGVSSPVLDACDHHLAIPMLGVKTSLNAAVACGVALFALVWRQS
jgi:23S rRNA (guanosine2251-2'-O)-methyltransferase